MGDKLMLKETLDRWIGTPYLHMGRNKYAVDCANFVAQVLIEEGLMSQMEDQTYYSSTWFWHTEKEIMLDNVEAQKKYIKGTIIELKEFDGKCLQEGDLLLFRNQHFNIVNHMGIYYGGLEFVHCIEYLGVRKDRLFPFWINRLVKVLRIERNT
jgi:cell wall-associated NlpC family hydrolase